MVVCCYCGNICFHGNSIYSKWKTFFNRFVQYCGLHWFHFLPHVSFQVKCNLEQKPQVQGILGFQILPIDILETRSGGSNIRGSLITLTILDKFN
jgi:hypothetical protein